MRDAINLRMTTTRLWFVEYRAGQGIGRIVQVIMHNGKGTIFVSNLNTEITLLLFALHWCVRVPVLGLPSNRGYLRHCRCCNEDRAWFLQILGEFDLGEQFLVSCDELTPCGRRPVPSLLCSIPFSTKNGHTFKPCCHEWTEWLLVMSAQNSPIGISFQQPPPRQSLQGYDKFRINRNKR